MGTNAILERLDNQIAWYDGRSQKNQAWFKGLKVVTILCGALIPFSDAINLKAYVASALGVIIIVVEGIQQMNQYHSNWLSYRSTCEALRHEKYLYAARAAYYGVALNPLALLSERMESLISQEHAKWATTNEIGARHPQAGPPLVGVGVGPGAPPASTSSLPREAAADVLTEG